MPDTLTIAVSRGRILTEFLPILARLGIAPGEDPATSRKLIMDTSRPGLRLVLIRASDIATYVEHGTAELGIAGKDMLMEYQGDGLYEPLDLGIGRCRMMLAARAGDRPVTGRLRVATKYVQTTRAWFADQGRQVEIIRLYGSMELAPVLGLAHQIVDLVDTGQTLRANGLVPLATIADISSRLIVNKAAMKIKHATIRPFIAQLAGVVGG